MSIYRPSEISEDSDCENEGLELYDGEEEPYVPRRRIPKIVFLEPHPLRGTRCSSVPWRPTPGRAVTVPARAGGPRGSTHSSRLSRSHPGSSPHSTDWTTYGAHFSATWPSSHLMREDAQPPSPTDIKTPPGTRRPLSPLAADGVLPSLGIFKRVRDLLRAPE